MGLSGKGKVAPDSITINNMHGSLAYRVGAIENEVATVAPAVARPKERDEENIVKMEPKVINADTIAASVRDFEADHATSAGYQHPGGLQFTKCRPPPFLWEGCTGDIAHIVNAQGIVELPKSGFKVLSSSEKKKRSKKLLLVMKISHHDIDSFGCHPVLITALYYTVQLTFVVIWGGYFWCLFILVFSPPQFSAVRWLVDSQYVEVSEHHIVPAVRPETLTDLMHKKKATPIPLREVHAIRCRRRSTSFERKYDCWCFTPVYIFNSVRYDVEAVNTNGYILGRIFSGGQNQLQEALFIQQESERFIGGVGAGAGAGAGVETSTS